MDFSNFQSNTSKRSTLTGCTILVVDDDPTCLGETLETINNLGYPVVGATNAFDALRRISEIPEVGIVITDVEMPNMDGISLLSEIEERFLPTRPIVTLVVTGHASVQIATKAMQSQAVDFLSKPLTMNDLASALRRAFIYHSAADYRFQIASLNDKLNPLLGSDRQAKLNTKPTKSQLLAFVQLLLKVQHSKSKFFDSWVLAGPPWEILLELTEASLRGEAVPASSASASTLLPLSTVLRHVENLVNAGLVRRWRDPLDRRRLLLKLEPNALTAMTRYLESSKSYLAQPE